MSVRNAAPADIPSITAIYRHYVQHTVSSLALDVSSEETTLQDFEKLKAQGFPYVVFIVSAEDSDGKEEGLSHVERVTGYAYARPYHDRGGFNGTAETSIYIDPAYAGRGQGRLLLREVITRLTGDSAKTQLIAQISLASEVPEDDEAVRRASPSVALHSGAGFRMVGRLSKVGWKFGRWVDVVVMQRALRDE